VTKAEQEVNISLSFLLATAWYVHFLDGEEASPEAGLNAIKLYSRCHW